jgi:hypothetical protein
VLNYTKDRVKSGCLSLMTTVVMSMDCEMMIALELGLFFSLFSGVCLTKTCIIRLPCSTRYRNLGGSKYAIARDNHKEIVDAAL